MSEPTKGLPDEEFLKQWASDYAKSEHKGCLDSMAAEILRLRAELAKASGKFKWGDCTYEIATVGWGEGSDMPNRVFIRRTHANGRDDMLSYKEPFQSDAEVERLKGDLAKASAEVQRLESERPVVKMRGSVAAKDGMEFVGNVELRDDYDSEAEASQAAKVEEWDTTTDDLPVSTERLAELRTSYAAGAAKESMSEPTRSRCRDAVKALDELLEVRAAKDAPPADVLGISKQDVGMLRLVVYELSQVVERIARAQKQEDR